jgi:hypothetical protein
MITNFIVVFSFVPQDVAHTGQIRLMLATKNKAYIYVFMPSE